MGEVRLVFNYSLKPFSHVNLMELGLSIFNGNFNYIVLISDFHAVNNGGTSMVYGLFFFVFSSYQINSTNVRAVSQSYEENT